MRSGHGLYIYPWDIMDHDDLPDLAAGLKALGISRLCMAAAYHTGKFLRPHGRDARVYFPQDGAVYLPTDPGRYGTIRPIMAQRMPPMDVLRTLHDHGLAISAWTVLFHNTALGTRHPQAACHNAFGDCYPYSLCPSNADVRAYGIALCRDIASHPYIGDIILETPGWQPFHHGFHHEMSLLSANAWPDTLLGLCFCDACMEGATRAGVNAAGLRRRVRGHLSSYLARQCDGTPAEGEDRLMHAIVQDDALRDFLRWRCRQVTSLVRDIHEAVRADATVHVIPSVQANPVRSWIEGSDLEALSRACDGLEVCLYGPDTQALLARFEDIREIVPADRPLRPVLRPAPCDFADAGAFVAQVEALSRRGVRDFAFYNFGHLRRENLNWIYRALDGLPAPA
ncbi:hypothetical protein [Gluconacetobacter entanii]|uniref:hypothetical protein n=1 Tax=Gluconacetobacter entanii TaxID=108528 RepID=UPI0011B662B9|nr:hypothetical protein [Gluconacetobacter entanii]MCE2578143.1 hypothetical protein [Komagataeibacter sp. FNDCR1]